MPWPWRRSKLDLDLVLEIPSSDRDALLHRLGIDDRLAWQRSWQDRGIDALAAHLWAPGTSPDWLWSLALPLLTAAEGMAGNGRLLIGLSALPGCGKTTLGHWLEAAASALGGSLAVVSIDDFYLPSPALDQSMEGNPWGVPRALPGSHDIQLMQQCLTTWKQGGTVELPCFDKSLRNGRGDRSGWRRCDASVLMLEGWFVGCQPLQAGAEMEQGAAHLVPPLSSEELRYRSEVQRRLMAYESVWMLLDQLWQIRAPDLNAPCRWKLEQNSTQAREQGTGLPIEELRNFIRMVTAAIPSVSFDLDQADVVVSADLQRRLKRLQVRR